jgi:hypothetical protein
MKRDKMLSEAQFEMILFAVETEAQKYIQDFLSTVFMRFKDMMAENESINQSGQGPKTIGSSTEKTERIQQVI